MLLTGRGMGDATVYGPTDAQLGINLSSLGSVFPSGSVPDQVSTCVQAGGPLTDCVQAVISTSTSGMPSWVLPVGLGVLGLLLVKAMSR